MKKIQGSELGRPNFECQVHKLTIQFLFSFVVRWEQRQPHGALRLEFVTVRQFRK